MDAPLPFRGPDIFSPLAAGLAGIAAGGAATAAQMLAWWAGGYPPVDMLLRDSRLAAAIVLGTGVLPPPVDFDGQIMLVASVVHLALSVIYGLVFTVLAARLRPLPGLAAGGLFGLALFTLNMFGMTALFPWFSASRDWMTAAAHLVFGASLLPFYRLLSPRQGGRQRKKNAG